MAQCTTYRIKTRVDIKLQDWLNIRFPDSRPEVEVEESYFNEKIYSFTTRWSHDLEFEVEIVDLLESKQGFIWIDEEGSDLITVVLYNKGVVRNTKYFDKDFVF
jgi:hypothetical protein